MSNLCCSKIVCLVVIMTQISGIAGELVEVRISEIASNESSQFTAVVINCTVDPETAGMDTITELSLKTSDPCSVQGVYYQVATADIWSEPRMTLEADGFTAKVSGQISKKPGELSYLAVTLDSVADGRSFMCRVWGITENGDPLTESSTVQHQSEKFLEIQENDSEEMKLLKEMALKIWKFDERLNDVAEAVSLSDAATEWYIRIGLDSKFTTSVLSRGKIYLATKYATTFNITRADTICEGMGGYLAELDDDEEYQFIHNFVGLLGGSNYYFTGANDIDKEGKFVHYHSGKPLMIDQWASGQPYDASTAYELDCVAMRHNYDGLYDRSCETTSAQYLCEVPFPPSK